MRRLIARAVLCGALLFLPGCTETGTDPDDPVPAALAAVGGTGQSGAAGTALTAPLTVRVTDKNGEPITGVTVSWTITAGGGSLNMGAQSTDGSGESRAVWTLGSGTGAQMAKATVGDLAPVTFTATAVAGRAAVVVVSPGSLAFDKLGATTQLSATVRDAYGNQLEGPALAWTSSNTQVAEVGAQGLVTSKGNGTATIMVVSDTARAEVGVLVDIGAASGLQVTGISPATLTPGTTATLTGIGFSANLAGNVVTIAGVAATILTASPTRLMVSVPSAAALGCQPTRPVNVTVAAGGSATFRMHPLRVARQLPALAVGSHVEIGTAAEAQCNELPQVGGRYLVSVYNTSTSPTSSASFRLRGEAGSVAAAPAAAQGVPTAASARPGRLLREPGVATVAAGPAATISLQSRTNKARQAMRTHAAVLEESRGLHARFGPPPRRAAGDPGVVTAAAPTPLTAGAMLDLRVPKITTNSCTDYTPVRARVVYAGPKAVVLEDSLAPLARTMDSRYEALGREFEISMLPVLEEYFGDPFAIDSLLGNSGKVLMLFTPAVNDFGNVAGFVTSADFYPRATCASSDLAQIFYAIVPTVAGSGTGAGTAEDWHWTIRATVIHEVKHIVSFAERYARNATVMEESWLEESTARLSEELWGRKIFGNTFRGRARYQSTIYCEVRSTWPECLGRPFIMTDHFATVYDFLTEPNAFSPLGRQDPSDWSFYGSGWFLVRWAIDHHANDEKAFVRSLIQEHRLSGVQNLEARTGKSFAQLLGPWSLSMLWDKPTGPLLSTPSWDMHDIFRGLHNDFKPSFPEPYPLGGWNVQFGSFNVYVEVVRGGSAAFTLIGGTQQGTQLLELMSQNGGAPTSTLRLAILRIE